MDVRLQFNGLVLLYGYLQRIYVHDQVLAMLGEQGSPSTADDLPPMLALVGGAMRSFDPEGGLSPDEVHDLESVVDAAQPLVAGCLPQPGDSPGHQLAAVSAAVYAEDHVNNGIVRMGDLLDPDVADRFRQRIPSFRNRVAVVTNWVERAADHQSLTAEEASERDRLLADVTVAAPNVESDLRTVRTYLTA